MTEHPEHRILAAFGVSPSVVPSSSDWVDITDSLERFNTSRGRSHELDRPEAGSASLLLEDIDADFDSVNESSPYYPNIEPGVRIRIELLLSDDGYTDTYTSAYTGDSGVYCLFEGFADGWNRKYNKGTEKVEVPLSDGFKYISLADVDGAFPSEGSGKRIDKLLDEANWPKDKRHIDTGQSVVSAKTYDSTSVLSAIRKVAESENGVFFIDRAGFAVFEGRHARLLEETDPRVILDQYDSINRPYDDSVLWNKIIVNYTGGKESAQDSDSIDNYGKRTNKVNVQIDDNQEAQDIANWLLNRYKTPRLRYDSLSLETMAQSDLQRFAAAADMGHRVTVRFYHVGKLQLANQNGTVYTATYESTYSGPDFHEQDMHVEKVEHEFGPKSNWTTSLKLSPAIARDRYWILGHSQYGILGETTRLAY